MVCPRIREGWRTEQKRDCAHHDPKPHRMKPEHSDPQVQLSTKGRSGADGDFIRCGLCIMIPVMEFRQFSEQQPAFRVLKPWWDVFTDYLSVIMLMIGVFGCTLQVMQDKIICLPQRMPSASENTSEVELKSLLHLQSNISAVPTEMRGLKTDLDLQQYSFINQMCYEKALHCSKIEHFISMLGKCFDSPWTTRALSEVSGENPEEKDSKKTGTIRSNITVSPGEGSLEKTQSLRSIPEKIVVEKPSASVLDKKEGEQAKALFEKVKKFRLHVEEGDILYLMYVRQTVFKVFKFLLIIAYNSSLVNKVRNRVRCEVEIQDMTGYKEFECNHTMAHLFSKLSYCYLCLVAVYGLTSLYTSYWLFYRSLKEYSFEYVRQETGINDIPDVKNDFAFMLHMIDQYDPLYSKRFAVFLSEVSENKLKQLNLNHNWTAEKLRQRLQTNTNNRLELQLFMLPGLPDTVFELTELQSLKLEIINNVTIPASISQLEDLQELSLCQCSLKLHTTATSFLKENLKVLRVKFDDNRELPNWMYGLRNLEELYLTGSLSPDASKNIVLESLREMKCLKTLSLKSNLTKILQSIVDVSSHLQRLSLHNDGTKLVMLNNLKKMANLTELELVRCDLERIPHAIFSLTNLQELDLKENNIRSIEEIISFQHLRKLTCLKLWYNGIMYIPEHIKKLGSLERLYFSHNKIEILPSHLFLCNKLRYLDLSNNDIRFIPPEIGVLQSLQYFSVTCNKIENLPDELFFCKKLKTLKLGKNSLSILSPKISYLVLLTHLELKGNHFELLPQELGYCRALKRRMFTLTEVASLNDIQPTYRILKPWWDVFMDYLGIVMLMLAIFSGTMQLTKDQVVCLPILEQTPEGAGSFLGPQPPETADGFWNKESAIGEQAAPLMAKRPPDSVAPTIHFTQPATLGQPQPTGVRTKLDFQQYVFVNQMCYHVALPWYSKYFPYLALIHTIVLMVSSNFWFKYPKTSSKIEHFVSILGKCFESPWTTKALSETACEDSEENKQRLAGASSLLKHLSTSSEEGSPNQSAPVLTKSGVTFSAEKLVSEIPSMTILDKKDGEQAKALFEKVRKFRAHVEDSDLIYRLYAIQTVIKTVKFILILCYTMTFVASIDFDHVCEPEIKHLTGYAKFHCTHNMAFMLKKLLVSYIAIICVYGIICIYTLFWLFRRPLKEYSFEKVREESSFSDIPDVKNDFAFLLHMVDQYDQLYSKRFGVFLSEVSENKLREISLNHEWTFEKLRQHVTRNSQEKLELHLFMLSGVPDAVFDLTDLEILKLELIPEARITAKISQMINLQELHFYHCPAKVEQTAFIFLRDHLRCLHVKFTDVAEIPSWVYLLKSLRELYLVGNLNSENNKMIGLESLRDLRHLKILHLKSNLTKIPTNITDLSPHLIELVIHNDGTKLLVLNSLKKMMNLAQLELHNCELERIPHAIFSLSNLQELDLKSNNIRTIEEIISFQHLKRLTCLKLWHNKIITIPLSISHVKNLESLYLSHNKLESLPSSLFTLLKLRYLDVSHNSIVVIPLEVGFLQNLQHFAITGNKVEVVPKQLFKCTKLRTLCLGHNCISSIPEKIGQLSQLTHLELKGNCLDRLPAQLGQCGLLRRSCFIVEDHLFDSLPMEVKESVNQESSVSFTNGCKCLSDGR
ncbi:hypothetical protein INR49_008434 [Caranx melampygus]|nr:hypothetical protein INR49_008434 [Caranx melampygus]